MKTPEKFNLSGQLTTLDPNVSVVGLRVEVWDKDLIHNDLLASSLTDENGRFHVEFDSSYYMELFTDRRPDLFFKIYRDLTLIKNTIDSVLWNVDASQASVKIPLGKGKPEFKADGPVTKPLVRVRSHELSLWQSVVAEFVADEYRAQSRDNTTPNIAALQDHPMIQAVNKHVIRSVSKEHSQELDLPVEPADNAAGEELLAYLSELCHQRAKARVRENTELENRLTETYRKYSDKDPGFLSCETTYLEYKAKYNGILKYNSWVNHGGLQYGVIDYKIPNTAKVAIIGDWGTGMTDAYNLLYWMVNNPATQPDIIIHLGDIYYSGTPAECMNHFARPISAVLRSVSKNIPVFTIPGNHDYYAFAYGYYDMVRGLNSAIPTAVQDSSYFCLQTEDGGWQFLGMDTGHGDANPTDQINTYYAGPQLVSSEIAWHQDKLNNFSGNTVLLSHHQLFSHHAKINGSLSTFGSYPNLNKYLLDVFQPYFGNKVAAWLWGHEHNQVIYQDGLYGLPKGRLLGASAYEELTSEDPYAVKYPNTPIDPNIKLSNAQGYYNHGFAIIDFSVRNAPKDPVKISYYEYPSWGSVPPPNIPRTPTFMFEETIAIVPVNIGNPISYGQTININLENGLDFISHFYNGNQYYPTVGQQAVQLTLQGGSGQVRDGDVLQIQSLESGLGSYDMLGAWSTPALYYYTEGYSQENWIIRKVNNNGDPVIHEGEAVHFINQSNAGQFLCPLIQVRSSGTWLSTDANVPANWFLRIS